MIELIKLFWLPCCVFLGMWVLSVAPETVKGVLFTAGLCALGYSLATLVELVRIGMAQDSEE